MATVELRYSPKDTAWFTANAAMILKAGEPAYHETTGQFKLGDGVTALSALSFLPATASTPTLQQVLTAGSILTANNTIDSGANTLTLTQTTLNVNGRSLITTTGIPASGEPNEIIWNTTGSTLLTGNNYGFRMTANFESDQNNSAYRLGALLGVFSTTVGNTGDLGYGYGVYGVAYKVGGGIVTRNYGGHFIGSNKGSAGSVTLNAGATFQTEAIGATTGSNFSNYIHSPIVSGAGAITTNYGLYVETQIGAGIATGYAIYQSGASDFSKLEGGLIVNGSISTATLASNTSTTTPLIIGGSAIGSRLTYKSTTGVGTAAGVAHEFVGGTNGATAILKFLNNGNIIMPNNRSFLLVDSAGANQTLFNWSAGDNLTIQGRQGFTDISINPTTTSKGMTIKSQGRVGIFGVPSPTAYLMLGAGTAGAANAPFKFTTGTNLTTAEAGAMEYNNTFHLTNSDATRRHIVLAPNSTKVTAAAPYTNDGYVTINIGGVDIKVMTTA